MTQEDLQQLQQVAGGLPAFERVGVFSPWREAEGRLWPKLTALPRWRWDLDRPGRRRFDLLVACNVFMFASDAARWFRHVFACSRYFLLLDVVRRRRSSDSEFFDDRLRFKVGNEGPRVEPSFDLATLGDRLLGYHTFFGGANEFDDRPLHFIALFRGDLAEPVLRIDDYPTGIRPILPDLSPLHEVLRKVEQRALPYHLGIVPALLTDEMFQFLGSLQHIVPVVHGYDHAYPKYAPILEAKGDPYNERTVGTFNEFKGQPYEEILAKLRRGRQVLEDRLGRPVTDYIPPCNRGNRKTGRALRAAGYHRYFSETRIRGCAVPGIRSDFYGRSSEYDYTRAADVVTLHTTWEWDLVRKGETRALDRLLDHLAARRQTARAQGAALGALVAALPS